VIFDEAIDFLGPVASMGDFLKTQIPLSTLQRAL
jgi:hypothetical protein